VTVDYGQAAADAEIQAAASITKWLGVKHKVLTVAPYVDVGRPKGQTEAISIWWPFRNQLLVTLAAIATTELGASEIQIGLVKGDIYKDCTAEFVRCMNRLLSAQERKIKLNAPARHLTTLSLLKNSSIPYDLLGITISCHVGNVPCGQCAGCSKSARVKREYKLIAQSLA
jgi:7-cyano-7-deazaguanine synthase